MIGFVINAPWKIILALIYCIMCFLGFSAGFREGLAALLVSATFPFFTWGIFKGIKTKRYENFFVVPCWILAIIIALVIYPEADGKPEDKTDFQPTADIYASQQPVITETPVAVPSSLPEADENGDMTVYTGKSGSRYHNKDCPSLRGTEIPMTLKEAKEAGKTPCKRCIEVNK